MVGPECTVVAAVKSEAATIIGYVGGVATSMMLDLGSFVSLFKKDLLLKVSKLVKIRPILQLLEMRFIFRTVFLLWCSWTKRE